MVTLFTIPRAFEGKFITIQNNAILSWLELGCEIILFGNETGVEQLANKYSIKHINKISLNDFGTPILSDALEKVTKIAHNPLIGYINCDMILLPDFINSVQQIIRLKIKKFLVVGQRRPLSVNKIIVGKKNWQNNIKYQLRKQHSKPVAGSSDYFVYPSNIHWDMPPFAVGKLYWDRWFFYQAKLKNIPAINATSTITAIHQQHYQNRSLHGDQFLSLTKEAKTNLDLIGGRLFCFSIFDADYVLDDNNLKHVKITFRYIIRKIEINLIIASRKYSVLVPILEVTKLARRLVTYINK